MYVLNDEIKLLLNWFSEMFVSNEKDVVGVIDKMAPAFKNFLSKLKPFMGIANPAKDAISPARWSTFLVKSLSTPKEMKLLSESDGW